MEFLHGVGEFLQGVGELLAGIFFLQVVLFLRGDHDHLVPLAVRPQGGLLGLEGLQHLHIGAHTLEAKLDSSQTSRIPALWWKNILNDIDMNILARPTGHYCIEVRPAGSQLS